MSAEVVDTIAYIILAFVLVGVILILVRARKASVKETSQLAAEMEEVRADLKAEEISGKYTEEDLNRVIGKFNHNARTLGIPEYK